MRQFFVRRWFLLMLGLLLAVGFAFHRQLEPTRSLVRQEPIVAAILFLMALPLEAGAMWRAMRRPRAVLLAVAINFGLLPLVAWPVSLLLWPEDLAVGLLIAASVPSTLASAAVWTRRAGGNDSVALLVMMITNVSCFLVTPMLVLVMTGAHKELPKSPGEMIVSLALWCVLPVIVAQLLRLWRPLGAWATRHKAPLGVLAQCGILSIVLVGAIVAGQRLAALPPGESMGPAAWLAMLAAVVAVHLSMLAAGHLLGRWLGLSREDRIAVGFAGSQKTLMVGLHLANTFGGLAILPMVAYHVCQLLVDTVIADRLLKAGSQSPVSGVPKRARPARR